MKTRILLIILVSLFAQFSYAQTPQGNDVGERKIKSYNQLKNAGAITALSGGIIGLTGVILSSNSFFKSSYPNPQNRNLNYIVGGIALGGVALVIVGGVVAVIGNIKVRQSQDELSGLSFSPLLSSDANGLCLQFKF